jgi:hypothetical protein
LILETSFWEFGSRIHTTPPVLFLALYRTAFTSCPGCAEALHIWKFHGTGAAELAKSVPSSCSSLFRVVTSGRIDDFERCHGLFLKGLLFFFNKIGL